MQFEQFLYLVVFVVNIKSMLWLNFRLLLDYSTRLIFFSETGNIGKYSFAYANQAY